MTSNNYDISVTDIIYSSNSIIVNTHNTNVKTYSSHVYLCMRLARTEFTYSVSYMSVIVI